MKYLILLGDGMADYPLDDLGGKTPLEHARTPHMDRMAREGTLGLIDTIPEGLPAGSDVANLTVLGYDPRRYFTGRAPLEAASMGIALAPSDVACRCNLVTLGEDADERMVDFTAGHISPAEAKAIVADLQREIGSETVRFYPGVGYRNLMVWSGGNPDFSATPPHDITGKPSAPHLPTGPGAGEIVRLMRLSKACLADHPVNRDRRAKGLKPANAIWLWGQGRAPQMAKIADRFNIRGGVISAVDLLNGIGVYAGLKVIRVAGATGYTDTDYAGKAREALRALGELDLVFVHVEAPDEMGHEGNLRGKIRSIEDFDEKVVGTVLDGMDRLGPARIAVLSDHPTPISIMTHASDPSPFAVWSSVREENQARGCTFGESAARGSGNLVSPGYQFMDLFMGDWRRFVENKTR